MALDEFAGGGLVGVEGGEAAVALGVVVAGVEDGLARERFGGEPQVGAERDGRDDEVARRGGLGRDGGAGGGAEFADEVGEGLGAAGVREDHFDARRDGEPGEGGSDHAGADDAECLRHGRSLSRKR
nr:hypothetical protein GCM10025732_44280 [Glycomyces mayteni]